MELDQDNKSQAEGQNLQQMLDDLGLGDDAANFEASKKDSTVFIIDCSEHMLKKIQGEEKCQLQMIFEGYYNFLQRKIIANASDKVGLILYNVNNTQNSINQENIFKVHSLDSEVDARRIKQSSFLFKDFQSKFGGISGPKVSINFVLWEYGAEISNLKPSEYYLRVFLFTANDNPHPIGDQERQPSIKRAQQLAAKNVQIQLFPIRTAKKCFFDIRKFYQQVITFDPDEINSTVLDSSSKILDLQERLRQKQFKKRTLNRLTMKIGKQTDQEGKQKNVQVGVKIYSLFTKAKKPCPKKVDAKSNKLLQRITKKLNSKGQILFDGVVGTYYPLGGEKIKISKDDMNKIKNLEPPGMTLVGFKPKNLIKPYYNLRTSYFLYPDEDHISGSSQFFDAMIGQLTKQNLVGIVKLVPRNNQQLRFAALFPQQEKYDEQDHFQTPPGFNMVILPFADDIVNFIGDKTIVRPSPVSTELIQVTKLLINNLTINNFDFRDFQSPSLQKFYSHLQAHALNEKQIQLRPDLLEPDAQGFKAYSDIIELVKETVMMDCQGIGLGSDVLKQEQVQGHGARKGKVKKQNVKLENAKREYNSISSSEKLTKSEQQNIQLIMHIENLILQGSLKDLKVTELKEYLQIHGMDQKGKKQQLIDRILVFMQHKNSV